MSPGLFPGMPRIAFCSADYQSIQTHFELHLSQLCGALWPNFPVILLNVILFLHSSSTVYIPQLQFINMETMASQVSNHNSQKNQEACLERALALAHKKTANFHCPLNVWTATQPSSIVWEIADSHSIILVRKDDDETDWQISDDDSEGTGVSTLSSDIDEDDLEIQQLVRHVEQAHSDKTSTTIRIPLLKQPSPIENTEVSTFLLLIFVPFFLFSILWKVFDDKNNVVW